MTAEWQKPTAAAALSLNSSRWTWKLLRQDGQFPAMERQLVKKTGVQRMKCGTGAEMDSRQVAG